MIKTYLNAKTITLMLLMIISNLSAKPLQDECPRGKPDPIIKKKIFPNTSFHLKGNVGFENVVLENGDQVFIENKGCEYFVIQIKFITSRFSGQTDNLKYWSGCAATLVNNLEKGLNAPVDFKNGLRALKSYYNKQKHILGTEVDFGGSDIRSFVTLNNIKKLTNSKYELTVTFTTGPL